MDQIILKFISLAASFVAVALVLSMHEFAHAFVAYKCGDPTPKFAGRLTMNPIRHFDLLGLMLFAFAGFGWAKPVPINPNNFRHYKRGLTLTAIAGVAINYLSVFFFYPLFLLALLYLSTPLIALDVFLKEFTLFLCTYSLSFCVFNLIPLPPLDGSRVLRHAVGMSEETFAKIARNAWWILLLALNLPPGNPIFLAVFGPLVRGAATAFFFLSEKIAGLF